MNDGETVRALLRTAGRTYAEQAGIRLTDKPAPLYRLLVLSVLLSTRISADIAVDAAAELRRSGMGTPARMRAAGWQQRVDALGRARYKRYDESTATGVLPSNGFFPVASSYRTTPSDQRSDSGPGSPPKRCSGAV